ncbi:hypothetical protein K469DRAFT_711551, partial [Zopfia rhizophila CBS 207.26]
NQCNHSFEDNIYENFMLPNKTSMNVEDGGEVDLWGGPECCYGESSNRRTF